MANTKPVKKRRSPAKKIVTMGLGLVLLFVSGLMIYSSVQEFMTTVRLNNELRAARQEYESSLSEQEKFENEKAKLNDPDYVQNYARGTHLLTSKDEQVFILVPESDEE